MENRMLKWGLLSTARINRALIPPILASKRSQLAAVASRIQEKAAAYASEWKIAKAYGSYEDLLKDPEIDVLYNSLPNHMHAEWTIRAAKAGKHVLCEKPIALSVEDVDSIAYASRKAGVVVAEAFMYRHHPLTMKVKEFISSGAIGEVLVVRGSFSYVLNREGDVRLDPAMGGGSLWDVGCYPVSYARYVSGKEPEQVFGWQVTGPSGVDEVFTGQLRFPGGSVAMFDCGFRLPGQVFMEFVGTQGSIRVPSPYKPGKREHFILTRNGESTKITVRSQELYLGEVEDMEEAVLYGKTQRVSLEDSRNNTAVLTALLYSAKVGLPMQVESV